MLGNLVLFSNWYPNAICLIFDLERGNPSAFEKVISIECLALQEMRTICAWTWSDCQMLGFGGNDCSISDLICFTRVFEQTKHTTLLIGRECLTQIQLHLWWYHLAPSSAQVILKVRNCFVVHSHLQAWSLHTPGVHSGGRRILAWCSLIGFGYPPLLMSLWWNSLLAGNSKWENAVQWLETTLLKAYVQTTAACCCPVCDQWCSEQYSSTISCQLLAPLEDGATSSMMWSVSLSGADACPEASLHWRDHWNPTASPTSSVSSFSRKRCHSLLILVDAIVKTAHGIYFLEVLFVLWVTSGELGLLQSSASASLP